MKRFSVLKDLEAPRAASPVVTRKVLQWTGIPVSVGIAPTKTLEGSQPHREETAGQGRVCNLMAGSDQVAALLALALTDLWVIAGRIAARLEKLGIDTPLKLRDAEPSLLRDRLGVVMGRMALELRGVPCHGLIESTQDHHRLAIVLPRRH